MKHSFVLALIAILTFSTSEAFAELEGLDIRILDAKRVFYEINSTPDKAIPQDVLAKTNAIIIFPDIVKGGFIYAARYGTGVALARNSTTGKWSPPAFIRISGGSFGFQIGAQHTELILVGRDHFSLKEFAGGANVSGTASASFGPWGVHSELGTGWALNSSMHWFSRNKGLFASVATDGSVLNFDEEANEAYYGKDVDSKRILYGDSVEVTPTAQMLLDMIAKYTIRTPDDIYIVPTAPTTR